MLIQLSKGRLDHGFIDEYVNQVLQFSRITPKNLLEVGVLDGKNLKVLSQAFGIGEENQFLVEPNPIYAQRLKSKFPRAKVYPVALSDHDGAANFLECTSSKRALAGCSSLHRRVDGWSSRIHTRQIQVPVTTGEQLLSQVRNEIDLCIIDVEGHAYQVLRGFGAELGRIRSLMIECEHQPIFEGQVLYHEIASLLETSGFTQMAFRFSYSNQSDSIWIRNDLVQFPH